MHKHVLAAIFLLSAIPSLADQVVLKNGDRLSGSIVKSDGKELVIKTEFEGDVTIKFDAIKEISSTGDLHVSLGNKTVVGPVTTSGDNVVVTTKTAGPVEGPLSTVTLLRSPSEEAAYEKSEHPGLLEGWNGGFNLGFALTAGNSQTRNLNVAFNAVRKGARDKLVLYENTVRAVNDRPPTPPSPQTTANSNSGGVRYDHDLNRHLFGFVAGDLYANSLQNLDLRYILGGGLGLHAINTPATQLDVLVGGNYTHESYSDVSNPNPPPDTYSPSNSLGALTLGDNFAHRLGKSTVLTQSFVIYPDLSNTSEYRFTFNFGTVTKINKWLGWQNSLVDTFVSNPPAVAPGSPRIKRNDLQLATGINISFTH